MRYLLIVSRAEPTLYEYLKNQFAGRPHVDVVLDRRHRQRRQRAALAPLERRQAERRQRSVDEDLASLGVAITRIP